MNFKELVLNREEMAQNGSRIGHLYYCKKDH